MSTNKRILVLILLLSPAAWGSDLYGRVIRVADGDTFTLLTPENQQIRIRLAEIDAPESDQTYGDRSKQLLSELTMHKEVSVKVQTMDRYGRTIGRPYIGDLDVSNEMVRLGAAWAYRQYLIDDQLLALESEARAAKRGLWGISDVSIVPPWEWRRNGGSDNSNNDCRIKGNINSKGERIYHPPSSRSYGRTRITESSGERWFCSEEDARIAGWRPSKG